ncbi:hypothetical protein GCM10007894_22100 [Paraferrimonas haliotis]|uniref:Uncharacterized protein n=1 Tax=Paraferrimonas haliotis TaxID=2013866 RepID=A0AA37TRC9_9GAMM|nr:hypothetical protein GCM10007894_22100 [Paraferrimonas haliotis]
MATGCQYGNARQYTGRKASGRNDAELGKLTSQCFMHRPNVHIALAIAQQFEELVHAAKFNTETPVWDGASTLNLLAVCREQPEITLFK